MNILFLTENEISPVMGGTEHITDTLATEFRRRGHRCYLCYEKPCDLPLKTEFDGKLRCAGEKSKPAERKPGGAEPDSLFAPAKARKNESARRVGEAGDNTENDRAILEAFLRENSIDIIVSNLVTIQSKRRMLPLLYELTRGTQTKMVNCLHAMPGEEVLGGNPANCIYRIKHGGSLPANIKDIALHYAPQWLVGRLFKGYLQSRYRLLYDNCDSLVLLSEKFFSQVASLAGIPIDDKFKAIGNALSFESFASSEEIAKKGHNLLLLSRMDEKPKRVSSALRIWRRICQDPRFDDWQFTIVGGGPDLEWYRELISKMNLQRVTLEGRQSEVAPYYQRAAIFVMTSAYEGWGITLTEAQQYGVVPIAFHTYASLPDIIDDGINGCMVPGIESGGSEDKVIRHVGKATEAAYAERLKQLMADDEGRRKMASAAVRSSRRFRLEVIADQWLGLFESLLSSKAN